MKPSKRKLKNQAADFKRYLNLARLARCLGNEQDQELLLKEIRSPDFHGQLDEVFGLIQSHLYNQGRFKGQSTPLYM